MRVEELPSVPLAVCGADRLAAAGPHGVTARLKDGANPVLWRRCVATRGRKGTGAANRRGARRIQFQPAVKVENGFNTGAAELSKSAKARASSDVRQSTLSLPSLPRVLTPARAGFCGPATHRPVLGGDGAAPAALADHILRRTRVCQPREHVLHELGAPVSAVHSAAVTAVFA